jgi:hypothetical protein
MPVGYPGPCSIEKMTVVVITDLWVGIVHDGSGHMVLILYMLPCPALPCPV